MQKPAASGPGHPLRRKSRILKDNAIPADAGQPTVEQELPTEADRPLIEQKLPTEDRSKDAARPASKPAPAAASTVEVPVQPTRVPEPQAQNSRPAERRERPGFYVLAFLVLAAASLGLVWRSNQLFAPEMYQASGPKAFAQAFARGENYAVFDLNINIREMRDHHIASMEKAPEVAVLGASHWQEAHTELLPGFDFYNAHVHRDYYEDMLAVVEIFDRHKKLPKKMIIAIRDRLFTPVADRTDFLWLPGIPYYEVMAGKLGIKPHYYWETAPVQRWRELLSTSMLFTNVSRWYKAPVKPHPTVVDHHESLDTLRPGGSIYWSSDHQRLFTPERSEKLAKGFAEENFSTPPKIDPKGVESLDRLLQFLKEKDIEVYFVHPPFNPLYYNAIKGGPYHKGLAKIETITQNYAKKYGWQVFGSFDPADVGCTADMYIDAEHSNPTCLGKLLAQFAAIAKPDGKPAEKQGEPLAVAVDDRPGNQQQPKEESPQETVVASARTVAPVMTWPIGSPAPGGDEQPGTEHAMEGAKSVAQADSSPVSGPATVEPVRETAPKVLEPEKMPAAGTKAEEAPKSGNTLAAMSSLPPLPVQSSIGMPPLPVQRPLIGNIDCGPRGPHRIGDNPVPGRGAKGGTRS